MNAANVVTRDEYVKDLIPRTGMRKRLSAVHRGLVWEIREEIVRSMESTTTKEYVRMRLAEYLRAHPEDHAIRDISYLFVDETQDPPLAVICLDQLSQRSMVFAGDFDQSLYCFTNPFTRAGLSFQGRTKVLKTNFRNTVQIHQFAESWRSDHGGKTHDTATLAFPFREGPEPEVFTADSPESLGGFLVTKLRVYLENLSYEPETIGIFVPSRDALATMLDRLAAAGIPAVSVKDKEFHFEAPGAVRVATLHSSKGLDFSVVMLFMPEVQGKGQFDEEAEEKLARNLVYVGMTRALDCLDVFRVGRK